MTPRNYTDEELIREVERCYTDECIRELLKRYKDALQLLMYDEAEARE
jgi:hypothetical protein